MGTCGEGFDETSSSALEIPKNLFHGTGIILCSRVHCPFSCTSLSLSLSRSLFLSHSHTLTPKTEIRSRKSSSSRVSENDVVQGEKGGPKGICQRQRKEREAVVALLWLCKIANCNSQDNSFFLFIILLFLFFKIFFC